ncbi:hypothetical protein P7C73_g4739, partial [Tremellales sp. Uapishka_1]
MVLINDKKFACGTCIKGHRVSNCTHTDRPLFEVKRKGRPPVQCQMCKEKRKGSNVHVKCACGDVKTAPAVLLPPESTPPLEIHHQPEEDAEAVMPTDLEMETRRGQPGSRATFPNGLKDVHEMAAAAEAMVGAKPNEIKVAERRVENLLNPCHCRTGGRCKCCGTAAGTSTQSRSPSPRTTETLDTPPPEPGAVSTSSLMSSLSLQVPSTSSAGRSRTAWSSTNLGLSPSNLHHPAHTSPHVHKTKLYSPYSTSRASSTSSASHKTAPAGVSRVQPLADMTMFLDAIFREDGTIASEIPRSAVGLPGIKTFDQMAQNGGVDMKPFEAIDIDMPLSFPTAETVVIGACTCGKDCQCPNCATHGTPPNPASHSHGCGGGESCNSCFNCSEQVFLPSGITSVEQLISMAAAKVPSNPPRTMGVHELNPTDTRVLAPSILQSDEIRSSMGFINVLPLECCNGRCQCPPGDCTCGNECCGCCVRCACDEDGDVDVTMGSGDKAVAQGATSSCCGGGVQAAITPPVAGSSGGSGKSTPPTVFPLTINPPQPQASHHPLSQHRPYRQSSPQSRSSPQLGTSLSAQHAPHWQNQNSQSLGSTCPPQNQYPQLPNARPQSQLPPHNQPPHSNNPSSHPARPAPPPAPRSQSTTRPPPTSQLTASQPTSGTSTPTSSLVRRSSSTRKPAAPSHAQPKSKALALSHPHPRAILPKPSRTNLSRSASLSELIPRGLSPNPLTQMLAMGITPFTQPQGMFCTELNQTVPMEQSQAPLPPSQSQQAQPHPHPFRGQSHPPQLPRQPSLPSDPPAHLPSEPPSLPHQSHPQNATHNAQQQPPPAHQFSEPPNFDPSLHGEFDISTMGDAEFLAYLNSLEGTEFELPPPESTSDESHGSTTTGDTSLSLNYLSSHTQPAPAPFIYPEGEDAEEFERMLAQTLGDGGFQPPAVNPDLIDLSKPLNPSDVDRILQALLKQQDPTTLASNSVPHATPPPLPAERDDAFFDQFVSDPVESDSRPQRHAEEGAIYTQTCCRPL